MDLLVPRFHLAVDELGLHIAVVPGNPDYPPEGVSKREGKQLLETLGNFHEDYELVANEVMLSEAELEIGNPEAPLGNFAEDYESVAN